MAVEPPIHYGVDMIGTDIGSRIPGGGRSAGQRREITSESCREVVVAANATGRLAKTAGEFHGFARGPAMKQHARYGLLPSIGSASVFLLFATGFRASYLRAEYPVLGTERQGTTVTLRCGQLGRFIFLSSVVKRGSAWRLSNIGSVFSSRMYMDRCSTPLPNHSKA